MEKNETKSGEKIVSKLLEKCKVYSGVLFFILAAQFMIIVMLSETIAPDYNLNESVISKLGIISSTALLFNISLFLVGILNIIGGFLYYQSHKDLKILIPFLLAGIGASGAGIFSLNTPKLHVFFAIFVFLFFNLQAIVTSFRLSHFMKYISLFMGILGFIYVVIMIIGDAGVTVVFDLIGHGGTERMIVYPPIFWLMVFGGFLMKKD